MDGAKTARRRRVSRVLFGLSLLLYVLGAISYLMPPNARPSWMPGYSPTSTSINMPLALFCLIFATYCLVVAAFMAPRRTDAVRERQRELEAELHRLKRAGKL